MFVKLHDVKGLRLAYYSVGCDARGEDPSRQGSFAAGLVTVL